MTEAPALRRPASLDLAPQQHRVFLIMLGRGRLREPSHALTALAHFVRERLLPQDQVALIAWNRATDFTTDHEQIAQAIERFDRAHEAIEGRLDFHFSALTAAYGTKEIPRRIQDEIDAVFHGASGASGASGAGAAGAVSRLADRRLLPGAIPDSQRLEQDARSVMADVFGLPGALMNDLPLDEFISENARTLQDLGNLYAAIEYLRFLDGEKHLILVTQKGLMLPREEDDERIAETASNARVVIDTIETGGLYVGQAASATQGGPNPGQWSQWWAFQSLRNIAELTGGRSSIAEYTRTAVDRIDASTRAGYLLGYYPKNLAQDGRYRKVTVKVARPGLTLLYRHGYDATDQIVPFDRQTFLTFNRIMSAALYPEELRDIGLKVRATPVGAGTGSRDIAVDVKIDAARISWARGDAARTGRLDVVAFGVDSHGRVADQRWQTLDLALDDEQYERVRRDGLAYSVRLPYKASTREVKVIVYDYAADLLGTKTVDVF